MAKEVTALGLYKEAESELEKIRGATELLGVKAEYLPEHQKKITQLLTLIEQAYTLNYSDLLIGLELAEKELKNPKTREAGLQNLEHLKKYKLWLEPLRNYVLQGRELREYTNKLKDAKLDELYHKAEAKLKELEQIVLKEDP